MKKYDSNRVYTNVCLGTMVAYQALLLLAQIVMVAESQLSNISLLENKYCYDVSISGANFFISLALDISSLIIMSTCCDRSVMKYIRYRSIFIMNIILLIINVITATLVMGCTIPQILDKISVDIVDNMEGVRDSIHSGYVLLCVIGFIIMITSSVTRVIALPKFHKIMKKLRPEYEYERRVFSDFKSINSKSLL